MDMKKSVKKIIAIGFISVIGLGLVGCTGVSQEDLNLKVKELSEAQTKLDNLQLVNEKLSTDLTSSQDDSSALTTELDDLKLVLDEKDEELLEYETSVADAEELEQSTYLLDELQIGSKLSETLTDKELSLLDTEIKFDGDYYEFEEFLVLEDLEFVANLEDQGADVFMLLPEGGVSYSVVFEDKLDLSEVSDDEPLEFSFLGEDIKVTYWDDGEITFSQGATYSLAEGESMESHGMQISVDIVGDDWARVSVGDDSSRIDLGEFEELNGVEVKLAEVYYQGYVGGIHAVELYLGEDVELTIEDGDEWEEDSAWEWSVGDHTLGLVLVEDFTEVDEDEEFQALAAGDFFSLPLGFKVLTFEGLSEEDMYKYSFKVEGDYLELKGDFTVGTEDYDKLYVSSEGFFEDKGDEEPLSQSVEMDGTEFNLVLVTGEDKAEVVMGEDELVLALDMSYMFANGVDLESVDEDYRTEYGLVLDNPEDSLEDGKLKFEVPEEQLELSLKITK